MTSFRLKFFFRYFKIFTFTSKIAVLDKTTSFGSRKRFSIIFEHFHLTSKVGVLDKMTSFGSEKFFRQFLKIF